MLCLLDLLTTQGPLGIQLHARPWIMGDLIPAPTELNCSWAFSGLKLWRYTQQPVALISEQVKTTGTEGSGRNWGHSREGRQALASKNSIYPRTCRWGLNSIAAPWLEQVSGQDFSLERAGHRERLKWEWQDSSSPGKKQGCCNLQMKYQDTHRVRATGREKKAGW